MRVLGIVVSLIILSFQVSTCSPLFASSTPFDSKHGVNFAIGNKDLSETDIRISTPVGEFAFKRSYNSQSRDIGILGYGWTTSLEERVINLTSRIVWVQSSGRDVHFVDNAGIWENQNEKQVTLDDSDAEYKITEFNGTVRTFEKTGGKLTSKTDHYGNTVNYGYTGDQLTSVTDNFGNTFNLGYNATTGYLETITVPGILGSYSFEVTGDNLTKVTRPDGKFKTYIYNDPNEATPKHNLTGIKNEYGVQVQTIEYDTEDRVVKSIVGDGVTSIIVPITIVYPADPADMTRTVVQTGDGGDVTTHYTLEVKNGVYLVSSYDGPTCCGGSVTQGSYTYNSRGQIITFTDANNNVT